MIPFHESLRYEYPLTSDSLVIDAGAYEGNFSKIISEKYGCRILAFEPIKAMADLAASRLTAFPKVQVFTLGIGGRTRTERFSHKGDMTGIASVGCTSEEVNIRDIAEVMEEFALQDIALLKLNVEGCEFEILERILDAGFAPRFRHLQVQFHPVVPDYAARHDRIRERLSATHELQYDAPWIWTGWRLKP
jgi:FkbM family methyltransferase